ncbi:MAG TPA: septal ring lytic transglycosylase RlpA family protein [Arcobacter sp.]|nr:septal ring lytic transglycosylase RlpA family protein [Arcobacter sp.]
MKLLSNLNKLIILSVLALFISGCTKKSYNSSYYQSKSYKSSKKYKKIHNQEIRNSKAMHRATMRSYVIAGKRYNPTTTKIGAIYTGIASWYGPNFHAKLTSNGEIYNMHADTAASKTLPMNTMVKVYNKDNGKYTIVRINDRGPFVTGRIIDLSNKAAHKIDMVKKGTANIKITVIGFNGKIAKTKQERTEVVATTNYFVQVGAFSSLGGAKKTQRKFNKLILEGQYNAIIKQTMIDGKRLNRVWVSGFRSQGEAEDFKNENGLNTAMIIAN